MRFPAFCTVAVVGFLLCSACSDNSVNNPSVVPILQLDQLATMDTSGHLMVYRSRYAEIEPFLTTERLFGEPFTDNNGNGVYDEGVDGFVISVVSGINQDINHNGKYDGPDASWTPGMPFDDIDGNGLPRGDGDAFLSGAPFMDLNNNGIRDSEPYLSSICKLEIAKADSTGTYYDYYFADTTHTFLSDSLVHYFASANNVMPGQHFKLDIGEFRRIHDTLFYGVFPILCEQTIKADSVLDSVPGFVFTRKVTFDQTYKFFDREEMGLVRAYLKVIRADSPIYADQSGDFYFSSSRGPVGLIWRYSLSSQPQSVFFGAKVDTLPLPMVR